MSEDLPPKPTDLDFDSLLPTGQQWFAVWEVAGHWSVSVQHIINLVNEGRFTYDNLGPVNLASHPGKTRATTRIPRASILAFLHANKL